LLIAQTGVESAQNQIEQQGQQNPKIFLLLIPLAFLLIGPGEELLYRGVIQNTIREKMGPVSAIGIASLIFAVIHITALAGSLSSMLVYIIVVFGLSLILGSTYEKSGNLVVP
ncbi:MAG: CPBP family intramembrane glutamic endopeptidase, partial [Halobacteria archaeon]|nr:CPBP family intramembrane glutamic endopeptidase [Halobacteria archaeon]